MSEPRAPDLLQPGEEAHLLRASLDARLQPHRLRPAHQQRVLRDHDAGGERDGHGGLGERRGPPVALVRGHLLVGLEPKQLGPAVAGS